MPASSFGPKGLDSGICKSLLVRVFLRSTLWTHPFPLLPVFIPINRKTSQNLNGGNLMEMFGSQQISPQSVAAGSVEERLMFLKKVYGLLTLSLLVAVGAAMISPQIVPPGMFWPLFIAYFVLSLVAYFVRRKPGINLIALFSFTAVTGLMLGMVASVYDAGVVEDALILTVVIFASLTGYVIASKKDFSFLGSFLFTGLIIIIVGGLLSAFIFHNPMGEFIIAGGGVFLFSGFILYDTSNILRRYSVDDYVGGTLDLFMDVILLFMYLLRLLSLLTGRN